MDWSSSNKSICAMKLINERTLLDLCQKGHVSKPLLWSSSCRNILNNLYLLAESTLIANGGWTLFGVLVIRKGKARNNANFNPFKPSHLLRYLVLDRYNTACVFFFSFFENNTACVNIVLFIINYCLNFFFHTLIEGFVFFVL